MRLGWARLGKARQGAARQGLQSSGLHILRVCFPVLRSIEGRGSARSGGVRRGRARQGKGGNPHNYKQNEGNTMLNTIKVKITGIRPLLMHSDKLANPLDPLTKAHKSLTSNRKKTDEDHEAIAKSEWLASLYIDDSGPGLPDHVIEGCLLAGAAYKKLKKHMKSCVEVLTKMAPLEYDGPKTPERLWDAGFYDARSVVITGKRIMRYRPIFRKWAATFEIAYDPDLVNKDDVIRALEDAGARAGIGDYRPKFGRFTVEVLQ